MGQTERYAVAAVDGDNTYKFPAYSLRSVWERMLFPLKRRMIEEYGLQLFGIRLDTHCSPYHDRNFQHIVDGLDLGDPLNSKVRFLISDQPFEQLPRIEDNHPLLLAIELEHDNVTWSPHALNPKCVHVKASFDNLSELVADIILDIALTNSYSIQKILAYLDSTGLSLSEILKRKAEFIKNSSGLFSIGSSSVEARAPYVSFSAACRGTDEFGSPGHLGRFVSAWDAFLLSLLGSVNAPAEVVVKIVNDFPGFKRQLSPKLIESLVHKLQPGVHMLLVQRGGLSSRMNPKFLNEISAGFDHLEIKGGGEKRFGVFAGGILPEAAKNLVRKKAAYSVRLHMGGGK